MNKYILMSLCEGGTLIKFIILKLLRGKKLLYKTAPIENEIPKGSSKWLEFYK